MENTPTDGSVKHPSCTKILGIILIIGTLLGTLGGLAYPVFGFIIWMIAVSEDGSVPQGWQAIALDMAEATTVHEIILGDRAVTLTLNNYEPDDGPVDIQVSVDGQNLGILRSSYNYDLWSNDSPGAYKLQDVDGDRQRDMAIQLNRWIPESYYISGADGQIYPLDVSLEVPFEWSR